MAGPKHVLLVSENWDLFFQTKELLNPEEYRCTIGQQYKQELSADLVVCEYSLLPREIRSPKSLEGSFVLVLLDFFDEETSVDLLDRGFWYLIRPITPRILKSAISLFLSQHSLHSVPESIRFGPNVFHVLKLTVETPEGSVHLTPSESGILKRLLINKGQLCLRKHLLEEIKNHAKAIVARNVDVHIASLRKKLGAYGSRIVTLRGVGYLFSDDGDKKFSQQDTKLS
ncbi:two component system response regulator ChxR [Chlamydia trachomatis]|uniref:two component system response regulator ChxR n=1 Tax=Chlamydia trachomatis TaxID=813 RepID=UPI0001B46E7B|nr:two component system response regulator ChxR [Chlamydia trachomatis]ADH17418.1 CpxR [Chlamydia trachomatis E/150]ADH21112.1 CpxR [Chlamydia trachomatis E/11023]AGR94066.1 CpxR [Chlamydia trachomatis RC-F/69]AGR95912.1 CpxR [Chlamydia trachomatis RC-F(s)/852]AGR99631.1 CpxR [Chlamydia trachomatis RC-F(s)/342]